MWKTSKNRILKIPRISYVYVMRSKRYLWAAKIGKANNPARRLSGIAASIKEQTGNDPEMTLFMFFPTLNPYRVERAIHALKTYPVYKDAGGSGKTEWRYVFNPAAASLIAVLGCLAGIPCEWMGLFAGAALMSPRPFDFAIYVIFLSVVNWLLIALVLYGLFRIIF